MRFSAAVLTINIYASARSSAALKGTATKPPAPRSRRGLGNLDGAATGCGRGGTQLIRKWRVINIGRAGWTRRGIVDRDSAGAARFGRRAGSRRARGDGAARDVEAHHATVREAGRAAAGRCAESEHADEKVVLRPCKILGDLKSGGKKSIGEIRADRRAFRGSCTHYVVRD